MIYHNTKHNIFYYPIFRCGSSILRDISSQYDELVEYHDDEGFKLIDLNRECPIYVIYRDPETRFKSGLQITITRFLPCDIPPQSRYVDQFLDEGHDVSFENAMGFLDNVITTDIPKVSGSWQGKIMRPFHLYDSHIDHMLWKILILKAYDYNVVPLPINKYDSHLAPLYPKAYNDILKSHDRPETFKHNNKRALRLWDIYKKVFIENKYFQNKTQRPHISFKEWMDEERKVFATIEKFKSAATFKFACDKMITKLFANKIYFEDMYSPSLERIHELLDILHRHKKPLKQFELFHKTYRSISVQTDEFQSGQYIENDKRRK
jgi:hypothetical protein